VRPASQTVQTAYERSDLTMWKRTPLQSLNYRSVLSELSKRAAYLATDAAFHTDDIFE
jgi:hypothetical protein